MFSKTLFADINECEAKIAQCGGLECNNIPGGYECVDPKKNLIKYVKSVCHLNAKKILI